MLYKQPHPNMQTVKDVWMSWSPPAVDVENPVEHSKYFTTLQVPAANLGHNYNLHVYNEDVNCLKTAVWHFNLWLM